MKQESNHTTPGSHKARLRAFLNDLERHPPPLLDDYAIEADAEVWAETNCLRCANCCRTMSPVFTASDIKRIATHLRMSVPAFREKWLYKTNSGVWMNQSQPCQFLNLDTNKCTVYAVRPADCAGFPHLTKRRMVDYMHVHKQNLDYCPATVKLIEKIEERVQATEQL